MLIDEIERSSAVWKKVTEHCELRLSHLRLMNDGNLTLEQTQKVRGQIEEVKAILSLGTDRPVIPDENANFKD